MSIKIIAYIYTNPTQKVLSSSLLWGGEIDRVYQDIGDRHQWEKLILDCQLETPTYLLIYSLKALGDTLVIIKDRLEKIKSLGIEIVTIEEDYNTLKLEIGNNYSCKSKLNKLLSKVQKERNSNRLKAGHARNRLKILPPPGKAPYGYRRGQDKYLIDKSTAPVVKDFFARFILFGSLRGSVRYLEKRYGKKISPSTGRNWLTNPVYRGDLKYQDKDIVSNTHTPIIDREEAAQVDRLLRRNSRLSPRTASASRSLAGLVVCQQCQLNMNITCVTQHNKQREYLYLRCHQCPQQPKCKAIAYDRILEQTINHICLEFPLAVAKLDLDRNSTFEARLKQEIQSKQDIVERLPKLVQQEILDEETYALRNYKLRTEISQLNAELAQLPPNNLDKIAKAVSIPQFWLDLSETERRFYFREFIKQIELIRDRPSSWRLQLVFIF